MKLHPRYFLVRQAHSELSVLLIDWLQKHELTYLEIIGVLTEEIQAMVKYGIRQERHGDTDKKGDEQ